MPNRRNVVDVPGARPVTLQGSGVTLRGVVNYLDRTNETFSIITTSVTQLIRARVASLLAVTREVEGSNNNSPRGESSRFTRLGAARILHVEIRVPAGGEGGPPMIRPLLISNRAAWVLHVENSLVRLGRSNDCHRILHVENGLYGTSPVHQ